MTVNLKKITFKNKKWMKRLNTKYLFDKPNYP